MDQRVKADTLLLDSPKLLWARVEKVAQAAKAACLKKEAKVEMLGKASAITFKKRTPITR